MQLRSWLKSIFVFLSIGLLAFELNAAEKPMRIALVQEWGAFNPVTNQLASTEALFPFVLRRMVKRSAAGEVLPDIAEKIPRLDGVKATWSIRESAKWGDGAPILCADWHLGWQAGLNPKVSVDSRSFYSKIKNISWDEKAPKICHVVYTAKDWSFDRDLPPVLPSHLESPIFEKYKDQPEGYDHNTLYVSDPTNAGLYNGPFVISEFKLGSHIILTHNKHFYGAQAQIEKFVVTHIADTSALKSHLLTNQIDIISAVGFPPDTAISLKTELEEKKAKSFVRFQNSPIFQGLFFNLENDFLKDIKIREALSRSIDKEQITNSFFSGQLIPAEGILPPQHPSFKRQKSLYSKKIARQILTDSGWKLNSSGIREKNGKTLSLVFKTSAGIKVLESVEVYICDQFKDIGVQCIIKNEPPRILLGTSIGHGEFDLALFGQPIPPDTSVTPFFGSKEIPSAENSWAGGNIIRLNSKTLDAMLAQFDQEPKLIQRQKLALKIQDYLQSQYVMIPLYHRREAMVFPKNLQGLEDVFDGTGFNDPENWKLQ